MSGADRLLLQAAKQGVPVVAGGVPDTLSKAAQYGMLKEVAIVVEERIPNLVQEKQH